MRRRWSRCRVSRETRIGSGTRRNIKIHNNTWSNNRPKKLHGGTRIHREREKALDGLPARDHCGESDPQKRGGNGEFWRAPSPRPGGAPAPKIGSLSPLPPPPGAAHRARRGHASRRPATVGAADAGNPCQPASNAGFRAQPGPQRRGLRPLREKRCGGQKREPPGAPPRCATPAL